MRDEDIANGRDIDDQRIDLLLERHNRIVATVEHMYSTKKKLIICYGRSVGRHPLSRPGRKLFFFYDFGTYCFSWKNIK